MKNLTASVFQLLYVITKLKTVSYLVALVYMAVLNMLVVNGLSVLLEEILPGIGQLHRLFVFPIVVATFVGMLMVTYIVSPDLEQIMRSGKKTKKFASIAVYSIVGLLLLAYSLFSKML